MLWIIWLIASIAFATCTTILHMHMKRGRATIGMGLRVVKITLEFATALCGMSFGAELWAILH